MGFLHYGGQGEYAFDDRTLAHLKVVVTTKLRRNEAFFLNWGRDRAEGSGRVSLWLSPEIPLSFHFTEPSAPPLNRAWLEAMLQETHASAGLTVFAEDLVAEAAAVPTGAGS